MSSLSAPSRSSIANDRIEAGSFIRSASQVLSLAEVDGAPLILSADSLGFVSAWQKQSSDGWTEDPEHFFQAHDGAINSLLVLRSSRMSNLVEECEWPGPHSKEVSLEKKIQRLRLGSDAIGSKQVAALNPESPQPLVGLDGQASPTDTPQTRSCLSTLLSKFRSGCCRGKLPRHWILASAGDDGALRVWRFRSLSHGTSCHFEADFIIEWFSRGKVPIASCLELHDGTIALALKASHDALVVDPGAAIVKWVLYGHAGPVTALAQCVDGRIATGGVDGAVRLWERRTWADEGKPQDEVTAKAWADPKQSMPGIGVSSMAYFAHTQQQQQSESVKVYAQVFVQRAENLPKSDFFGAADPYVTVSLNTGLPEIVQNRTPARSSYRNITVFKHRSAFSLAGELGAMPESATIDFEVYAVGSLCCGKATLLGHCRISVDEIFAQMRRDLAEAQTPRTIKLHAPVGEGPFQDLKNSMLLISFDQRNSQTLDCILHSAKYLPLQFGQKAYVTITLQYSQANAGSRIRCISSKDSRKTSVAQKSLNPVWDEVLEIEVPAMHKDQMLEYPHDMFLHFEVWDYDARSHDDLLATLDVPLGTVIQNDGKGIASFALTLAAGFKAAEPSDMAQSQVTLRQSASANERQSRLFLAFQMITPCSQQLQCTIQRAVGIACMPQEMAPIIRLRLVEGSPILPKLTSRRTRVIKRTDKPAWKEKCTLPVPETYVNYCFRKVHEAEKLQSGQLRESEKTLALLQTSASAAPKPPSPASVRMGWEHEAEELPPLVFSADIFETHSGTDTLIGFCTLPLEAVISDMKDKKRWQQPERVNLNANVGCIYLGFEFGDGTDLLVNIDHAERLPHVDPSSTDLYCVVRIDERGAFQLPSGKVRSANLAQRASPVNEDKTNPVFDHEMLLDLPGSWVPDPKGGKIAMRANWYAHVEVVENDGKLDKEVPIMEGFLSLTELLSDLATNDMHKSEPVIARSRIDALRWGGYTDMKTRETPACDIEKDVELVAVGSMRKGAQPEKAVGELTDVQPKASAVVTDDMNLSGSLISQAPPAALTPSTVATAISPHPTFPGSPNPDLVGLNTIGSPTSDFPAQSEGMPNSSLRLRFKVVSRWDGIGRDLAKPLARSMPKASPVTCMMVLSTRLFAGYENGNIFIWDVSGSSSVPLHQFEAHRVPISGISYLQQGDVVVTTGLPRSQEESETESVMRTWSAETLQLQQTISLKADATRDLIALNQDSQRNNMPCLAVATETRQSKLIQMMRYKV